MCDYDRAVALYSSVQCRDWLFDSGVTIHISNRLKDFIPGTLNRVSTPIRGLANLANASWEGLVSLPTILPCGKVNVITFKAVYIKQSPVRIFAPGLY